MEKQELEIENIRKGCLSMLDALEDLTELIEILAMEVELLKKKLEIK